MKELTLVRHAKSSWSDADLDDFDRPLNKRGKADAPLMGKVLAKSGLQPDVIVSSPAVRAITTAKAIAAKLGYTEKAIRQELPIYDAEPETLLSLVSALDDEHDHALMVGHNPGFHGLANWLLAEPLQRLVTCGVVRMSLKVRCWRDVKAGCGDLIEYIYPKLFK